MSDQEKTDATSDTENTDATKAEDEKLPEGLGDAGKQALKEARDARKAAEKLNGEFAKELTALRQEKADREKAKSEADEAEATKKGEFETLAAKRKQEADDAKAEAKTHADKLARAETVLKSVIATRVKELESTEDKDLIAAFPKDAEPLEQLEWLDDPRTKSAMKVALEDKKVTDAQGKPKVPRTPNANGTGKESDEEARATQARSYRDW